MAINKITDADLEKFKNNSDYDDNALDLYQQIATKSAIYPGQGTPLGLVYVALKLNGEAGEVAEHVGKAMRDDALMKGYFKNIKILAPYVLTTDRLNLLVKEIGDVLWYLSAACNELGITLSSAAQTNLEKLLDRTKRDALQGSGDDR